MKQSMMNKAYLVVMLVLTVFISSLPGIASAAAVDLGAAAPFAGFGSGAGMTNQGIFTVVNGDIGTTGAASLVTGFHDTGNAVYTETPLNVGVVNGTIHTATTPLGSVAGVIAGAAELAAQTAYDNLSPAALPGGIDVSSISGGAGELGNRTLYPGVYKSAPGSFAIQGGDLTLDAQGDPNAVWVFQMASTLTVGGPGAAFPQSVILVNGAQASNVFWQVGSTATINAAGGGTMVGTIISYAGVAFSTAGNVEVVTLEGRALSLHASVTLVNTVINVPSQEQPVTSAMTFSVPSPQVIGTTVTLLGAGAGGTGAYEYKFYVQPVGGGRTWTLLQDWSATSTYDWNTAGLANGTYTVQVDVRSQGSTSLYGAFTNYSYVVEVAAATGAGMTFSAPSPQVIGATITLTGAGTGGTGTYEYKYYIQPVGGGSTWTLLRDWSHSSTFAWNTDGLAAGTYNVQVDVRSQGSTSLYGAFTNYSYVVDVAAASGASMTFSAPSPQVIGTTVTLTGEGAGGTGAYEYKYYIQPVGGGSTWTLLRDWSATSTFAWNTTGLAAGTYNVQVDVRSQGSTSLYGTFTNYSYTVEVASATGASMTFSAPSPQAIGTTVTITGAGAGGTGTYEYKYIIQPVGGGSTWTLLRDWSTVGIYALNTAGLAAGTYNVQVDVRSQGSTSLYGTFKNYSYTLN